MGERKVFEIQVYQSPHISLVLPRPIEETNDKYYTLCEPASRALNMPKNAK